MHKTRCTQKETPKSKVKVGGDSLSVIREKDAHVLPFTCLAVVIIRHLPHTYSLARLCPLWDPIPVPKLCASRSKSTWATGTESGTSAFHGLSQWSSAPLLQVRLLFSVIAALLFPELFATKVFATQAMRQMQWWRFSYFTVYGCVIFKLCWEQNLSFVLFIMSQIKQRCCGV